MTRQRAKPKAIGRCCWLCGKPGGSGCSDALIALGFEIDRHMNLPDGTVNPNYTIGYAHHNCVARARKKAQRK